MISRFERFSFAIFEISRCWHKIAGDEMARCGLKGPHAVYLIAMNRHPEGVTAAQLSEICARDKADVSRAVSSMEKKGMLIKEGVNNSLYRARLKLTDQGKTVAEHIYKRAGVAVEMGGKGLDDEQRTLFYQTIELIAANLRSISDDGLPH